MQLFYFIFITSIINLTILKLVHGDDGDPPLEFEELKRYRYEFDTTDEEQEDTIKNITTDHTVVNVTTNYRLPSALEPISYTIQILPILDENPKVGKQFTALASVNITVNCIQETNVIILHSFLLNITSESVTIKNIRTDEFLPIEIQNYDQETHFYNITTRIGNPLKNGQIYQIFIKYIAPVSTDRYNGLYLSSYTIPDSLDLKYVAATQLEPTRARQVFPCFDEPRWKSIFNVIIGRNTNYSSLSNEKIIKTVNHEILPGWVWDIYEPTVPMPTYLFAMVVADYDHVIADPTLARIPIAVYAPKYKIKEGGGNYAAEATAKILNYFETYFEVKYPLTKMDSIALPGKYGAMENYGLITYGNSLMYFPGLTTEAERHRLLTVITHELAHQWFGNLVTCEWWSDIWLNEGFASYFQYAGMKTLYNEYFPMKHMLNNAVQRVLKYDADSTSQPVVIPQKNVTTLREISDRFDGIVYGKAASLIRMLAGIMTEDILLNGLRTYLKRKSHMTAVQDDLFKDLDEQAKIYNILPPGKTIKNIMDTWTLKNGYPLVRVSRADSKRIYVSQELFTKSKENSTRKIHSNNLWEIPISIATKNNPNFEDHKPKLWLDKNSTLISMTHDTSQWIMFNIDGTGFYRVLYDSYLIHLIIEQFNSNFSIISPMSRSQLLDDYFNLAFQEYIGIETALNLTTYLAMESDFTVWNTVFVNFKYPLNLLIGTPAFESIKKYFEPRIGSALKQIGVRQLSADIGALVIFRSHLLDWGCAMDNLDCIQYAVDLFKQWKDAPDINPYPIDVQRVLYCSSVRNGGESAFNFFLEKYKNSTTTKNSDPQKFLLGSALACVKNDNLINRLLKLCIDPNSSFTKQESIVILNYVIANPSGRNKTFEFIQQNYKQIIDYYNMNAIPIRTFVNTLSNYYGTIEQLDNLRKFIDVHNNTTILWKDITTSLNNSIQTIEKNILWMSKFYEPMKLWFENSMSQ